MYSQMAKSKSHRRTVNFVSSPTAVNPRPKARMALNVPPAQAPFGLLVEYLKCAFNSAQPIWFVLE